MYTLYFHFDLLNFAKYFLTRGLSDILCRPTVETAIILLLLISFINHLSQTSFLCVTASRVYMILITVFFVFLPLSTFLTCYFQIIKKVNESILKMQKNGVDRSNSKIASAQLTWVGAILKNNYYSYFSYISCIAV